MRRSQVGSRGLTLIEILPVITLLGLLMATLAVGFSGAFGEGKRELARTGVAQIKMKLEAYYISQSAWPSPDQGLQVLAEAAPTAKHYLGPDQITDPWGNRYQLVIPGPAGHPYEILSYGADGAIGGEGEDADISSINLREVRG